ncbi:MULTISPECIES: DMT family transporter [Gilliamella]|uniref:EamA family transporter n=1 Tax=Gilliamella apicola TaxID=1196095 RepID=A0A556SYY7_9GAMM|nr:MULTISPECIES: EamA family transporter [Gilliamella]MBI0094244.1 EamA family transporter [Gilliamella sp. W8136]TSK06370.1 EamA family transporter [Gilliamella apicola]
MNKYLGILAVILASLLWGTTGTAATFAPALSPLFIGSFAMGIGGILQCGLATVKIVHDRALLAVHCRFLIVGALAVAIYPLAFYSSMRLSGVTIGTVVSIGSAPILSAIIEYFSRDFQLNKQWAMGALLGIIGMVMLAFSDNASTTIQYTHVNLGILLGLVAGLTYALYSWSARQLMLKGVNTKAAMGATFGCGGLLLIPVMLITGSAFVNSWNNMAVGFYMALIPMFLGYRCYGFGLSKTSASMATTITLLEPVIAAILAMLIVGEYLSLIGWIGMLLIFICLIMVTLSSLAKN